MGRVYTEDYLFRAEGGSSGVGVVMAGMAWLRTRDMDAKTLLTSLATQ